MKHVMVVDDEHDILACLNEALTSEGYQVTAVVTGVEAVDTLATEAPDLVILDLRMPGMSGLEVLRAIRRTYPELPVVICTALSSYRNDFDILDANVSAFLEKPIDLEELLSTVRDAIGQGETTCLA